MSDQRNVINANVEQDKNLTTSDDQFEI